MVLILEGGKQYWQIAKRFHEHRAAPLMRPTAVRDMKKLQSDTTSTAVLRRVNAFIAKHQASPPGVSPNGGGPRRA